MKILPSPWRGLTSPECPDSADFPLDIWNAEVIFPTVNIALAGNNQSSILRWDLLSPSSDPEPTCELLKPKFSITPQGLLKHIHKVGSLFCEKKAFASKLSGRKASVAIILRYPEAIGGGNLQLLNYAKRIRNLGHRVTFYGVSKEPPAWILINGFECKISPVISEVLQFIHEDIVLFSSVLDLPALQLIPNLNNKRLLHVCQGIETFHYGNNPGELYSEKLFFDLLHSIPVARISNSNHITKYFKDRYLQDCWQISNALSHVYSSPYQRDKTPFANLDDIRIMWVGDPRNYLKGFKTLSRMIDRLTSSKRFKTIRLLIVIPNRVEIKEIPPISLANVELALQVSADKMPAFYAKADILVSTSFYEGFGMPILEALSQGLPVVTTDSLGLQGVIEDGKHALIVPPGDSEKLANAVESLALNFDLREQLRINGVELAKQFNEASSNEEFNRAFSEILGLDAVPGVEVQSARTGQSTELKTSMHSASPKFSILMPTYNQAHFIGESIESVLRQPYGDFELVICDDGSTDDTAKVIAKYSSVDPRIRYVRKSNGGTGSALNRALQESKGKWICWLSSDDLYELNALQTFKTAIEQNPDCKFFHAHYYLLNETSGIKEAPDFQNFSLENSSELQIIKLLEGNHFNGITICIERSALNSIGKFNEGNRNGQDYEMWLRLSARFPWKFIKERVAVTRMHALCGGVAFPEAGIYDSAAGALGFINDHPFSHYFPLLNLKDPNQAWFAILSSINLSVKLEAFIYQGIGHVPAFLERLLEWLSSPENKAVREIAIPNLQPLREALKEAALPAAIDLVLNKILDGASDPFIYRPYDPFELMHKNMQALKDAGRFNDADLLRRFLLKVGRLNPGLREGAANTEPDSFRA